MCNIGSVTAGGIALTGVRRNANPKMGDLEFCSALLDTGANKRDITRRVATFPPLPPRW